VVSGGLLLSSKRQEMLTYQSRLQGVNVWTNLVFVLNGLIFMLIGLQLPGITAQLGDVGIGRAIGYGLAISFALIGSRFLCTFGAMIWTVFISRFITVADATPNWRLPLVAGWAGMRGVVSLGAALSIPLLLPSGEPFPHRNLILFITFVVILVTLVFQGLTLPWLIRKMKLKPRASIIPLGEQETMVQGKMAAAALEYLNNKYPNGEENQYVSNLKSRLNIDLKNFNGELKTETGQMVREFQDVYLELLEARRNVLREMNRKEEFDEEVIRKYQTLIDVEEFKIREQTSVYSE
jgi:CPA1 family monovalent cation:H+ antiporter